MPDVYCILGSLYYRKVTSTQTSVIKCKMPTEKNGNDRGVAIIEILSVTQDVSQPTSHISDSLIGQMTYVG